MGSCWARCRTATGGLPHYSNGSSMNMGGILYPVSLQAEPVVHIADLFVRGDIQRGW